MKYLLVLFTFYSSLLTAQPSEVLEEPAVDKRVELLSIAFRLARAEEYLSEAYPDYVEAIHRHYDKFKNHELIKYIREDLRKRSKSISYDQVMVMAINITQPPEMNPINDSLLVIPGDRWDKATANKFLVLLNQFYEDSNSEAFFDENTDLYKYAVGQFKGVTEMLDVEWFSEFYGFVPNGSFRPIIGLGIGGQNFGPKVNIDGKDYYYAIIGARNTNAQGKPTFSPQQDLGVLVHEFNHSYVNPSTRKHKDELEGSGSVLFKEAKEKLKEDGYGNWETMFNEALVRASVIKYVKDHKLAGEEVIQRMISIDADKGYPYMKQLLEELAHYDHREEYESFIDYMPEIVSFFNEQAKKGGIRE